MSIYRVTGRHRYRDHSPGEVFEATLEPDAEERAVKIGAITLIERSDPQLQPGSWRLPPGWTATNNDDADERPRTGASVIGRSK